MPSKGKGKSKSKGKSQPKSKSHGYQPKKVKSHPQQIQAATYIPKSRLLRFTDFRSFNVVDDAIGAPGSGHAGANFPNMEFSANAPNAFISNKTGTWSNVSLNKKGGAVPGIPAWVTRANGVGSAPYREAQCLSSMITVTAVPVHQSTSAAETVLEQDVIKMILHKSTSPNTFHNKIIDDDMNAETATQQMGVRSANLYLNQNGNPRGATLKGFYSYKKMNNALGSGSKNYFHADEPDGSIAPPAERDYWNLAFLPGNSGKYGVTATGGTRLPELRVSVKIEYIVLLSEPNTGLMGYGINEGNDLITTRTLGINTDGRRTGVRSGTYAGTSYV